MQGKNADCHRRMWRKNWGSAGRQSQNGKPKFHLVKDTTPKPTLTFAQPIQPEGWITRKDDMQSRRGGVSSFLVGESKGGSAPFGTRLCLQSVVCYTLCRRCRENAVAAGEGKGI